ncbi:CRISPR-associated protein APE2256 [Rubrobacter xylanophilus DSM 9941]|uniref:CRISPR-associated protein APE2256 n=1 Tax=Rubrobacter xylanophilus (strain DSM 9941 / JCM 11954 / NBRC 16129 / PRD-1) TaxID=266117 RepID=Q1AZE3_RUBXD|nr:putative CRISPR-associated protein [Rubrobacter xylanophilus]ABG03235.1 CRISPR-associated protein APE2256 [Rubrobacter xylanophilus DSM 9941]
MPEREKSRLVLTTCGTSILTNDVDQERRRMINRLANHKEDELTPEERERLDRHIEERWQLLVDASLEQVKRMSAELNGLINYYGGNLTPRPGRPDEHILLTSDTYLGRRVGDVLKEWLEERGFNVQVWCPGGLATKSREDFRRAMAELIRRCEGALPFRRDAGYHVAFNLTGGFKSVQGFMQVVGMFYADEMFYIFETGSSLITIPRLPIRLETEAIVRDHEQPFRRLGNGEVLPVEECREIPEDLLFEVDSDATLSEWGELIWQRGEKALYSEKLLEPLPGLRYSPNFRKKVQRLKLSPDRLATLNERLDSLSLTVRGKKPNLSGLDFKQLRSNPKPPSTHECDVWSDDERRLFGHYEGSTFIVDDIERGLH